MAGLFIGFLVEKCVACQRQNPFRMASFWFFTFFKSQAMLALLDSFQELYLKFFLFFLLSNFMKSSTVYAASLCTFVRFETMI